MEGDIEKPVTSPRAGFDVSRNNRSFRRIFSLGIVNSERRHSPQNNMTDLIILVAFIAVLYYIYILSRRVEWGLMSLLAIQLYSITFGLNSGLFGGVHLNPHDGVCICLLAAGVIRSAQRLNSLNSTRLAALGYLAVFAVSLVRGLYANGVLTASNESRGFVGPLLAALYFVTAPTDNESLRRYAKWYLYFGAALCFVAALAAVGLPVGMAALGSLNSEGTSGRYLPATGAEAIAICAFLSLAVYRYWGGGLLARSLPVMYFLVAIYLRHRTVWMMLLAGVAALVPLDARLFRRLLPYFLTAVGLVALLAVYGAGTDQLVSANRFSDSATNDDTLLWRINGWKELVLDEEQTTITILFGKSVGSGWWRIDPVAHVVLFVAPHNEYIQEYLRVGVVGLFLLLLALFKPLFKLWQFSKSDPLAAYPSTSAWAIIVLITLVGGMTYSIDAHAYALLGIAAALMLRITNSQGAAENEHQDDPAITTALVASH